MVGSRACSAWARRRLNPPRAFLLRPQRRVVTAKNVQTDDATVVAVVVRATALPRVVVSEKAVVTAAGKVDAVVAVVRPATSKVGARGARTSVVVKAAMKTAVKAAWKAAVKVAWMAVEKHAGNAVTHVVTTALKTAAKVVVTATPSVGLNVASGVRAAVDATTAVRRHP